MVRLMLVMILALASSRDLHRNGQQVIVVSSYNSFLGQFLVVGWTMSITIYLLVYCLQYTAIAKYELQSSGLSGYEVPLCCDH